MQCDLNAGCLLHNTSCFGVSGGHKFAVCVCRIDKRLAVVTTTMLMLMIVVVVVRDANEPYSQRVRTHWQEARGDWRLMDDVPAAAAGDVRFNRLPACHPHASPHQMESQDVAETHASTGLPLPPAA